MWPDDRLPPVTIAVVVLQFGKPLQRSGLSALGGALVMTNMYIDSDVALRELLGKLGVGTDFHQ